MKVKFFCPRWGSALSWDAFAKRVKDSGYDGIEAPVSLDDPNEGLEIAAALRKYNLLFIGQYWQSLEAEPDLLYTNFQKYLFALAKLNPISINAQTGKDYFSIDENQKLFHLANKFTTETGIPVTHETHRGKALFAAHITRTYLEKIPNVNLTLDISHWCNVHESLLHDQAESVDFAIGRTKHIHARIGHPQGAQVSDPRAPEWKDCLDAHLTWWDSVVAFQSDKLDVLPITTEFGPAPYMPETPFSRVPVADQWDINAYMKNLLAERFHRYR